MRHFTVLLTLLSFSLTPACSSDQGLWQAALRSGTIAAYENYLNQQPQGKFKALAAAQLDSLYEVKAFNTAEMNHDIEAYRSFLRDYPDGFLTADANARIQSLEEEMAFGAADSAGTTEAYEAFLEAFPEGNYHIKATQSIDSLAVLERTAYEQAMTEHTAEAYEHFLRTHPGSEFSADVSRQLRNVSQSTELDYLRSEIAKIRRKSPDVEFIPILSTMPTDEHVYFVFKNEREEYVKVTLNDDEEITQFTDIPLLKYTEPLEGIILYISIEDILDHDIGDLLMAIMDRAFPLFGAGDNAKIVVLSRDRRAVTRTYSPEERKRGDDLRYGFIRLTAPIDSLTTALTSTDTLAQWYAMRALGVLGDITTLEAVTAASRSGTEAFREAAAEALQTIDFVAYTNAKETNTMGALENYLDAFPAGKYVSAAADKIAEKRTWQAAEVTTDFEGYSEYLVGWPNGPHVEEARRAIEEMDLLHDEQIEEIASRALESGVGTDSPLEIEQLLIVGAHCLDRNAKWIDRARGRKIYSILRKCDTELLSKAMYRVVLMGIERLQVLFLVVKLGVSGTEDTLVELLLKHGDEPMAEDYLNCGSKILSDGGAAWASRNGYQILTGPGSDRVDWGKF